MSITEECPSCKYYGVCNTFYGENLDHIIFTDKCLKFNTVNAKTIFKEQAVIASQGNLKNFDELIETGRILGINIEVTEENGKKNIYIKTENKEESELVSDFVDPFFKFALTVILKLLTDKFIEIEEEIKENSKNIENPMKLNLKSVNARKENNEFHFDVDAELIFNNNSKPLVLSITNGRLNKADGISFE